MSVVVLDRRDQRPLDGILWPEEHAGDMGSCPDTGVRGGGGLCEVEELGARTLDELVTDAWGGLMVRETVHCPACRGRMASCVTAAGVIGGGDCLDCGARLS